MLDRWYFPSFMGQAALTCFDALDDRPENHLGIMLHAKRYLKVRWPRVIRDKRSGFGPNPF